MAEAGKAATLSALDGVQRERFLIACIALLYDLIEVKKSFINTSTDNSILPCDIAKPLEETFKTYILGYWKAGTHKSVLNAIREYVTAHPLAYGSEKLLSFHGFNKSADDVTVDEVDSAASPSSQPTKTPVSYLLN